MLYNERVCADCEEPMPADGSSVFRGDCGYLFCRVCLNDHDAGCNCEYVNVDRNGRKLDADED